MLAAGVDLKILQETLGHVSVHLHPRHLHQRLLCWSRAAWWARRADLDNA
ncbi:hypothetical protein [Nonomuraea sp. NEAU-A123]|nr:hypothetical protein [Nonomuraea sp. NEAU-A123]